MTLFPEFSDSHNDSAILLSVKPKFANLIVEGCKLVELRRSIPARPVGTIAIYSSSPTQCIVALADVRKTIEASPSKLWVIAKEHGGGEAGDGPERAAERAAHAVTIPSSCRRSRSAGCVV